MRDTFRSTDEPSPLKPIRLDFTNVADSPETKKEDVLTGIDEAEIKNFQGLPEGLRGLGIPGDDKQNFLEQAKTIYYKYHEQLAGGRDAMFSLEFIFMQFFKNVGLAFEEIHLGPAKRTIAFPQDCEITDLERCFAQMKLDDVDVDSLVRMFANLQLASPETKVFLAQEER